MLLGQAIVLAVVVTALVHAHSRDRDAHRPPDYHQHPTRYHQQLHLHSHYPASSLDHHSPDKGHPPNHEARHSDGVPLSNGFLVTDSSYKGSSLDKSRLPYEESYYKLPSADESGPLYKFTFDGPIKGSPPHKFPSDKGPSYKFPFNKGPPFKFPFDKGPFEFPFDELVKGPSQYKFSSAQGTSISGPSPYKFPSQEGPSHNGLSPYNTPSEYYGPSSYIGPSQDSGPSPYTGSPAYKAPWKYPGPSPYDRSSRIDHSPDRDAPFSRNSNTEHQTMDRPDHDFGHTLSHALMSRHYQRDQFSNTHLSSKRVLYPVMIKPLPRTFSKVQVKVKKGMHQEKSEDPFRYSLDKHNLPLDQSSRFLERLPVKDRPKTIQDLTSLKNLLSNHYDLYSKPSKYLPFELNTKNSEDDFVGIPTEHENPSNKQMDKLSKYRLDSFQDESSLNLNLIRALTDHQSKVGQPGKQVLDEDRLYEKLSESLSKKNPLEPDRGQHLDRKLSDKVWAIQSQGHQNKSQTDKEDESGNQQDVSNAHNEIYLEDQGQSEYQESEHSISDTNLRDTGRSKDISKSHMSKSQPEYKEGKHSAYTDQLENISKIQPEYQEGKHYTHSKKIYSRRLADLITKRVDAIIPDAIQELEESEAAESAAPDPHRDQFEERPRFKSTAHPSYKFSKNNVGTKERLKFPEDLKKLLERYGALVQGPPNETYRVPDHKSYGVHGNKDYGPPADKDNGTTEHVLPPFGKKSLDTPNKDNGTKDYVLTSIGKKSFDTPANKDSGTKDFALPPIDTPNKGNGTKDYVLPPIGKKSFDTPANKGNGTKDYVLPPIDTPANKGNGTKDYVLPPIDTAANKGNGTKDYVLPPIDTAYKDNGTKEYVLPLIDTVYKGNVTKDYVLPPIDTPANKDNGTKDYVLPPIGKKSFDTPANKDYGPTADKYGSPGKNAIDPPAFKTYSASGGSLHGGQTDQLYERLDDHLVSKPEHDHHDQLLQELFRWPGHKGSEHPVYKAHDGPVYKAHDGPVYKAHDGPGYKAHDGPGYKAHDGPGYKAHDGPGYKALDGPGYKAHDGPGYKAHDGLGYKAHDGPGYKSHDGPGYKAHDGPGYKAYDGPGYKAYDRLGHDGPGYKAHDGPGYKAHDGPGYKAYDRLGHDGPGYKAHDGSSYKAYDRPGYKTYDGPGYKAYDRLGHDGPGYKAYDRLGHGGPVYKAYDGPGHDGPGYKAYDRLGHGGPGYKAYDGLGHDGPGYKAYDGLGHDGRGVTAFSYDQTIKANGLQMQARLNENDHTNHDENVPAIETLAPIADDNKDLVGKERSKQAGNGEWDGRAGSGTLTKDVRDLGEGYDDVQGYGTVHADLRTEHSSSGHNRGSGKVPKFDDQEAALGIPVDTFNCPEGFYLSGIESRLGPDSLGYVSVIRHFTFSCLPLPAFPHQYIMVCFWKGEIPKKQGSHFSCGEEAVICGWRRTRPDLSGDYRFQFLCCHILAIQRELIYMMTQCQLITSTQGGIISTSLCQRVPCCMASTLTSPSA